MSEYNKIKNPLTNRFVSTDSYLGKKILHKYVSMLGGGAALSNDEEDSWDSGRFGSAQSFQNDSDNEESVDQRFGRVGSDSDWVASRFGSAQDDSEEDFEHGEPVERFHTAEEDFEHGEPVERFHTAEEDFDDDSDSDEDSQ